MRAITQVRLNIISFRLIKLLYHVTVSEQVNPLVLDPLKTGTKLCSGFFEIRKKCNKGPSYL